MSTTFNPDLYQWIRWLHISCAAISISGFTVRGLLKLNGSAMLNQRWIKILPHLIDTVLLSCAIYLAIASHQYPFTDNWLTAKLFALLAYIGLGMLALRYARSRPQQWIAFILALLSFSYIAAVALTRSPTLGI